MGYGQVIEYFDRRAPRYLENSHRGLWKVFRDKEYAAVVELLNPKPGLRILDAGCGPGFYAIPLKQSFAVDILGLDISPAMVEQLRASGIEAQVGNVENFCVGPDRFDRVLAAGIFEFVKDPDQVFDRFFKMLKNGGRLVVLIPRAGWIGMAYQFVHEAQNCPTHILPIEEYKKKAAHAGFRFVDQISCTPLSVALSWIK